jgi:hypothetical protein
MSTPAVKVATHEPLIVRWFNRRINQRITAFTSSGKAVTGELKEFDRGESDGEASFVIGGKHSGDEDSLVLLEHISMLRPAREDE